MKTVPLRRALTVSGAFVAVSAMALTCAATASAAPVRSISSGQAVQISLAGNRDLSTQLVRAVNRGGDPVTTSVTAPSLPAIPGADGFLLASALPATATALANGTAYACSGLVAPGGQLQIGGQGKTCTVKGGSGGVVLDLTKLPGLPSLPLGIGGISVSFRGVTSVASVRGGVFAGQGSLLDGKVTACVGVQLNGSCTGLPINIPLHLTGTKNENVVAAIVTSLVAIPQLGTIVNQLTSKLSKVLSLRSNVQVLNDDRSSIKVVALRLRVASGALAPTVNLGIASAGPVA